MRRTDLVIIMDAAKQAAGGAEDFSFDIAEADVRSVDSILRHFVIDGTVTGWSRERDSNTFSVTGYTGE